MIAGVHSPEKQSGCIPIIYCGALCSIFTNWNLAIYPETFFTLVSNFDCVAPTYIGSKPPVKTKLDTVMCDIAGRIIVREK